MHGLKQKTIVKLWKSDLDSQEASKLVHADDIATLDLTLGQKKLLLHALAELNSAEKIPKAGETKPIETTPVTTKTLASDGGLEGLLKKDRRSFIKWPACHARSYRTDIVSAPREAWQQPAGVPCRTGQEGRWDTTILIPDFVSTENYDGSVGWGRTRNFWV